VEAIEVCNCLRPLAVKVAGAVTIAKP